MTSSLVGSEMCIRDRSSVSGWATEAVATHTAARPQPSSRSLARDVPAVSYTHLTLPTICSV
eukprot:3683062-Prorocentrum_lima.AAC.1